MTHIRLYFPKRHSSIDSGSVVVPASTSTIFTKKVRPSTDRQDEPQLFLYHHDPQWESLIEKAAGSYAAVAKNNDEDNHKCQLYIAQGIIAEMQQKGHHRFYQRQDDNVLHCLSQNEMLELTQKALVHYSGTTTGTTQEEEEEKEEEAAAASKKRKAQTQTQTLDDFIESNKKLLTPPSTTTNNNMDDATNNKKSLLVIERLRKKFVSILRVIANGSLTPDDQNSQIKTIAEDAMALVVVVTKKQNVDMADYDLDDNDNDDNASTNAAAAAPRRNSYEPPRLQPKDYFSSAATEGATEMACNGTVATKLLDNGLLASAIANFEPNSPMAACKIVRNLKIRGDRWYTGSVLYQRPHGIGIMKYKDGRILLGNWLQGTLHGQAVALYINGDAYIGGYLKNKRNGVGLYHYNHGAKYDGIFEKDDRHGRGVYTTTDGHVYDGTFVKGRFEGEGSHRLPNGTKEKGSFKNWIYMK
ncbi:unnamed protein product [Cylindrotheca closterium]|uniref:MORN repeat-containing protein 5 n=1 Tax=Cylindrotheca closterium TaxID=2856 RepID=A0AAD2FN61_9STRA|nr:unnamed protein product [Cylindrotheca closterium]